jgi:hypothetical protein
LLLDVSQTNKMAPWIGGPKDDGTRICMVAHNYPWDWRQLKVITLNGTMELYFHMNSHFRDKIELGTRQPKPLEEEVDNQHQWKIYCMVNWKVNS